MKPQGAAWIYTYNIFYNQIWILFNRHSQNKKDFSPIFSCDQKVIRFQMNNTFSKSNTPHWCPIFKIIIMTSPTLRSKSAPEVLSPVIIATGSNNFSVPWVQLQASKTSGTNYPNYRLWLLSLFTMQKRNGRGTSVTF